MQENVGRVAGLGWHFDLHVSEDALPLLVRRSLRLGRIDGLHVRVDVEAVLCSQVVQECRRLGYLHLGVLDVALFHRKRDLANLPHQVDKGRRFVVAKFFVVVFNRNRAHD